MKQELSVQEDDEISEGLKEPSINSDDVKLDSIKSDMSGAGLLATLEKQQDQDKQKENAEIERELEELGLIDADMAGNDSEHDS